jgi:hypothetical protein
MKDMVFIKGKEAVGVNILLLLVVVIFIVPIVLIFFLRFLYKSIRSVNEQAKVTLPVNGVLERI